MVALPKSVQSLYLWSYSLGGSKQSENTTCQVLKESNRTQDYVMSQPLIHWTTTDTLYYTVCTKTDSRARARKKYLTDRASVHTRERWPVTLSRYLLWSEAAPSQYWKWIDGHISDRFMRHSLTHVWTGGSGEGGGVGSTYPQIKNVDKFT